MKVVFCCCLLALFACQREDYEKDNPPQQIIIYETETEQPQRENAETTVVIFVKEDKTPPALMKSPVRDGNVDVDFHDLNRNGFAFEYLKLLSDKSTAAIESEAGRDLGWEKSIDGKIMRLRTVNGSERLKGNSVYILILSAIDLAGNGTGKIQIVFAT